MLLRPLALLSAVLNGLLAGGMILIELVLVPFWRAAPPAEFRSWFAAHSPRLRALLVPLGAGAGVVNVASALARVATGGRGGASSAAAAAAAAAAGVLAVTVTVNEPINHRFTADGLADAETTDLLARWARWHHLRVALGVTATLGAALALMDRQS